MRTANSCLAIFAVSSFALVPSFAQDDNSSEKEVLSCLNAREIRSEQVAEGQQTLVYTLRNGERYSSDLEGVCQGLRRNSGISYGYRGTGASAANRQICAGTKISVTTVGATDTGSCRLTEFHLISPSVAQELLDLDSPKSITADTSGGSPKAEEGAQD